MMLFYHITALVCFYASQKGEKVGGREGEREERNERKIGRERERE